MKNADKFKSVFGLYATELWSMPEREFLRWLGSESTETEQRWVPCSEKLPEERGFYLVSVGAPYKTVRVYEYKPCEGYENENLWKNNDGSYCFNWFVEAWMPLPEPYKGE